MAHIVNFVKWDNWTCSLYFDIPTFWTLYTATYDQIPKHVYEHIDIPAGAGGGGSTTGHHGMWPGDAATAGEVHAPLTFPIQPQDTWVGTGMWKYVPGTYVSGEGGGLTVDPYPGFWMNITQGDIDFKYFWQAGSPPQPGSYVIGLSDLVLLANAYGTSGIPPVPFQLGGLHVWEPGCDLAPPASVVGLSDLVTLAVNYGKTWGANPCGTHTEYHQSGPITTVDVRATIGALGPDIGATITEYDSHWVFVSTNTSPHVYTAVPDGEWFSVPYQVLYNGHLYTFCSWNSYVNPATPNIWVNQAIYVF
jgi:hypothetical protein